MTDTPAVVDRQQWLDYYFRLWAKAMLERNLPAASIFAKRWRAIYGLSAESQETSPNAKSR